MRYEVVQAKDGRVIGTFSPECFGYWCAKFVTEYTDGSREVAGRVVDRLAGELLARPISNS